MTEDVQINISGTIDGTALSELRKRLNETRNELNAVARETEKTDLKYKQLKETTRELNRLIKLSDTDLKKYASSLTQVSTAKTKLVNVTGQYGVKLGNVKNDISRYSSQMVSLTEATQQGTGAIIQQIGQLGLFAGGWLGVASALGLAAYNYRDWIDAHFGYDLTESDRKERELLQSRQSDKIRTPQEMLNDALQRQEERQRSVGIYGDVMGPGNQQGKNEWNQERMKQSRGANEKITKEVEKKIQQAKAVDIQGGVRLWLKDVPAMDISQGTSGDLPRGIFGGQPQHIETSQEAFARQAEQTLSDTQQVYSGISSIIGVLNFGTETFVSKLIGGFGTVLTIMEAIKTVNSILSIIPGFAKGGVASGLFMAGEKGAELIHVGENKARVYNHNDTMRMMNSQSTNPNVNVYLSANISEKFITAKIEQYTNQKRFKRV